ncbi:hypothetical protein [Amycolatopsis jiangsuensis]|uniref:Uncharacterized protein n=1 Tax=Amycolatopsis jiangsuensis TaxID=1181879 RepID=A0A840IKU6_9PSEU|nr:hypothetical protein [Amycolatopsis jiangsuensis]MBB4682951.1 hypothetical protein [Amycolatopsis jiangsuensis]
MDSEMNSSARPGLVEGARGIAGTLTAALYGTMTPHPWLAPDADTDAYSAFHTCSRMMGWLHDDQERPSLWGMNDADAPTRTSGSEPNSEPVAWFQVEAQRVARDQPLPAQPVLQCATAAMTRLGALELDAVQMLLPVQVLDTADAPGPLLSPSLRTAHWFADSDPTLRTPVQVTLDSGQSPAIPAVSDVLASIEQPAFAVSSYENGHTPITPWFDDSFWNGPPQHAVVFTGTLAEWSPSAIGWLAGLTADLYARHRLTTPLLMTVQRGQA